MIYVLEGEVELLVGERTIRETAGASAYAPRGILHTFKNVGTSPSRVLVVFTPGGLDKFFLEASEEATEGSSPPEGEPDMGRLMELAQKYGLEVPLPPGQPVGHVGLEAAARGTTAESGSVGLKV